MNKVHKIIVIGLAGTLSGCATMEKVENFMDAMVDMDTNSATNNKPINQDFVGDWVTTYRKDGESRGTVYQFTPVQQQFNANLTTYSIIRGQYSSKGTQPVTWSTSVDKQKIHTKVYDEKKTVFWALTWQIDKYDKAAGLLEVTQTFDGMKGEGSTVVLRKCGSPSSNMGMYQKLCSL